MTSSASVQYSDKSLCQDQVAGARDNRTVHDAIISSFLIPLPGEIKLNLQMIKYFLKNLKTQTKKPPIYFKYIINFILYQKAF